MRKQAKTAAVLTLGAGMVAPLGLAPTVRAATDWALNGTFQATSNGDWATTNDIYHNEASTRSTWTIAMTCSDAVTCTGRVSSDAGWSADIGITNGEYDVKRVLPDWEPCADGSGRTVTGDQHYRFFPVNEGGGWTPGSPVFAGFDQTTGETGGCSLNQELEIDMPFRLERLS